MSIKKHTTLDSLGLWAVMTTDEIIEIHDYGCARGPQVVITTKDLMELNKLVDVKVCECPPSNNRPVDTFVPNPPTKRVIKSDWPMAGFMEAIRKIFSNK